MRMMTKYIPHLTPISTLFGPHIDANSARLYNHINSGHNLEQNPVVYIATDRMIPVASLSKNGYFKQTNDRLNPLTTYIQSTKYLSNPHSIPFS
jgi:hypothetical protein